MQRIGDTTTLTTKDLYRQSIIRQMELINKSIWSTFEGDFNLIPQRLLGVYGLINGLKCLLIPYIREKGDYKADQKYKDQFEQIELNFNELFGGDTNEETYRVFLLGLMDWLSLLTAYFADVGIVPQARVMEYAGDTGLNKVHTMEDAIKFIKDGIKHLNSVDYVKHDYTKLPDILDKLEVNYAQLPPGHSTVPS